MTKKDSKNVENGPKPVTKPNKPLFSMFKVRWDFVTSLCSSVPANPDLLQGWLKARAPKVQPPNARSISEIQEEIVATLVEPEEDLMTKNLLVFQRVNNQLVMRAGTVRAHIKDCSRIISREWVGKIDKELSWSSRLINCTYLDERQYWLPVLKQSTGEPFTEPDGIKEKPVHLWNGNALKAYEFVQNARLEFTLKVLGGNIKKDDFEILFQYGGLHGYAGERGDGEGKYTFSIEEL